MSHWDWKAPWGGPRFYPPGAHPAMSPWKAQLEKLDEHKLQLWLHATAIGEWDESEDAIAELDKVRTYLLGRISEFEQGESEAKMRAYEIERDRQRGSGS